MILIRVCGFLRLPLVDNGTGIRSGGIPLR